MEADIVEQTFYWQAEDSLSNIVLTVILYHSTFDPMFFTPCFGVGAFEISLRAVALRHSLIP